MGYPLKSIIISLAAILFAAPSVFCETVNGSDGRITYIGRTEARDGAVSFDWTGVYLRVSFQGTSLEMKASDSGKNYYNVWLDKDMDSIPDKVISTRGADSTIVIFTSKEIKERYGKNAKALKAPHKVILQKRTEGSQGRTTIHSFTTDGTFLQADPVKDRVIEFIGDSYTCGYGTEASNKERFSPETENQNLTYACKTARYFGAEQIVLAHSGMGIARNYNGNLEKLVMPDLYLRVYDSAEEPAWDAATCPIKPDLTVIYLGTNDFSTKQQPILGKWSSDYKTLLQEVRSNYGESVPILCIASKVDDLLAEYVKRAVLDSDIPNVYWTAIHDQAHDITSELGSGWHPNYKGHRKVATCIIPYISTITGWEMPFTPVE